MKNHERLTIHNRRGQALAAVLHRPASSTQAGVIVAHGMLSSKDSPKHQKICARAAKAGLMAIRFDFRGRGESEGDPERLTVSKEIHDLRAVVAAMRELGALDISIVGSSLGGTVALLAAPAVAYLKTLVTIACPAQLATEPRPEWGLDVEPDQDRIRLGPGAYLSTDLFEDARRHNPIEAARYIACPWLIIHGRQDEVISVNEAGLLATANTGAELAIHADADHRFSGREEQEWMIEKVIEFVTRSRPKYDRGVRPRIG
jgi:predicted alpha/beta-hydrolase family hydrolase